VTAPVRVTHPQYGKTITIRQDTLQSGIRLKKRISANFTISCITIHLLTQETWDARILHSSKDRLSAIRINDYYQTYELMAAYLVLLDQQFPMLSKSE
jgi:hypothetical protein